MRTRHQPLLIGFAALLASAGCGGDAESMMDYGRNLGEHITALADEVEIHFTTTKAAQDLTALLRIEPGHLSSMHGHRGLMQHMMSDMMLCRRPFADRPDYRGISVEMASMQLEWEGHQAAMDKVIDLPVARTEEQRHQRTMGAMMDSLRRNQRSLMDAIEAASCNRYHH